MVLGLSPRLDWLETCAELEYPAAGPVAGAGSPSFLRMLRSDDDFSLEAPDDDDRAGDAAAA